MKTLIFNGSPRENGDTASLVRALVKLIGGECRTVDAYRCGISPCVDCRYCWHNSGCAIDDEMQSVYEYIADCDNIVIASPVYFSELTGRLLDVGSRLQTYYCAAAKRNKTPAIKPKKGAVILAGGGDGSCEKAYSTARILLHHMNCRDIHELVCSHDTDLRPAAKDENVLKGIADIAAFFNAE